MVTIFEIACQTAAVALIALWLGVRAWLFVLGE